jgi:hypothetical protein
MYYDNVNNCLAKFAFLLIMYRHVTAYVQGKDVEYGKMQSKF